MNRLIADRFNQALNDTVSDHFSLFGSTQMPALLGKLKPFREALKGTHADSAFWLSYRNIASIDALSINDLVLIMAVVHDFNEASISEVFQSLDYDVSELFEVLNATGVIKVKSAGGHALTHSDFERHIFRALIHQPAVMSSAAETVAFKGVSSLAGLISSGSCEGWVEDYLNEMEAQGTLGQEHVDRIQILSWLGSHCNTVSSLPNSNAAHYLRATAAFNPNFVKKQATLNSFWEDLLYEVTRSAPGLPTGHPAARKIFETLATDEFYDLHSSSIAGVFDNLLLQAGYEKADDEVLYSFLSHCFEKSKAWAQIQKPHVLLNLARQTLGTGFFKHVTAPVDFYILQSSSPSLAKALSPFRSDLFNQVLEAQMGIENRYFGLAPLVCPFGVRQIDDGDSRRKPDADLLKRYLIKTVPLAAHYTRSDPASARDREGMCEAVLNTYRYLVDEALKIKKFDWSFESDFSDAQRVFLVKSGLPMSKLERPTGVMREVALGVDLGL